MTSLTKTQQGEIGDAPELILYSKPKCPQCDATKRHFNKLNLTYRVIDVSEDDDAKKLVMKLGYLQAPVVVYGDTHWSGYSPTKIDKLFKK